MINEMFTRVEYLHSRVNIEAINIGGTLLAVKGTQLKMSLFEFVRSRQAEKFRLAKHILFDRNGRLIVSSTGKAQRHFANELINDGAVRRTEESLNKFLRFGQAVLALARSPIYSNISVGAARAMIVSTQNTRQNKIYFDREMVPSGFVSWAWLSRYSIDRLTSDPAAHLHPSEWNEGDVLTFRDLAVTAASATEIADDLSGGLFSGEDCLMTVKDSASNEAKLLKFDAGERPQIGRWIESRCLKKSATDGGHA